MFELFKKRIEKQLESQYEHKCEHKWVNLGKYYSCYDSEYRNRLDYVGIYMRLICSNCGLVENKLLSRRGFSPSAFNFSNEKQDYINELSHDIIESYEMEEKTINYKLNLSE